MKRIYSLILLLAMCIFASCGDKTTEVDPTPDKPIPPVQGDEIVVPDGTDLTPTISQDGGSQTVTFTAKERWSAYVSDSRAASDWLKVSPTEGEAGNVVLTITTLRNETPDDREGFVKIESGKSKATISVTQKQRDALTVSPSRRTVEARETEFDVEVRANVDFEVEIRADWIEQIKSRALTTTALKFRAKKNIEDAPRTGTIVIRSGEKSETIIVNQEKGNFIVDREKVTVDAAEQTFTANVRANIDFDVEVKADWIEKIDSRAMTDTQLNFRVRQNNGEERSGEIIVKSSNQTETIKVIQTKGNFLVDIDTVNVTADEQTFKANVRANVDFSIEIGVDWIERVQTRGYTDTALKFLVKHNVGEERTGEIVVKSQLQTETIKVVQEGGDFIVDTDKFDIDATAQSVSAKVRANIDFEVNPQVSWIHYTPTRGMVENVFQLSVDENTTGKERTGGVEISCRWKKEIITIVQGSEAFHVNFDKTTISHNGGQITATVVGNLEYSVEVLNEPDWITKVETRAVSIQNIVFDVKPNTVYTSRSAIIRFTYKSEGREKTKDYIITQTVKRLASSKDLFELDANGGRINITVGENSYFSSNDIEYYITNGVDWISRVESRTLDTSDFTFYIDKNTTGKQREGEIEFTLPDKTNTKVRIIQSGDVIEIVIPDANFKKYMLENFDKDGDGKITMSEALAIENIDCSNLNIKSLQGIEYFNALTYLNCSDNEITELDVSKNTSLQTLECRYNQLTSLDVSGCSTLQTLDCESNQLTNLNVSGCYALLTLYCYSNPLELLILGDVNPKNYYHNNGTDYKYPYLSGILGGSTKLKIISAKITKLDVSKNKLQSLDVSECPALNELYCNGNQLKSLDVSRNTALQTLYCHSNPLELFNLGDANPEEYNYYNGSKVSYPQLYGQLGNSTELKVISNKITKLVVAYNKLQSLDVSECPALQTLYCDSNQLTNLNVSGCYALRSLYCYSNQLTSLNVNKNTALQTLECYSNQLTSLNVSKNTALRWLKCYSNQLTSLDVSKNTALQTLDCNSNQLTSLDISRNTALQTLYCHSNPLELLNLGNVDTEYYYYYSGRNYLYLYGYLGKSAKLKVISNKITTLDVSSNKLQSLDVSECPALQTLYCNSNQLTSLDVSNNSALQKLYCNGNQLKSLDVSRNTALQTLYCHSNPLELLNLGDVNPKNYYHNNGTDYKYPYLSGILGGSTKLKIISAKITKLDVSKNELQSLDVSECPALQILYCRSNRLTCLDVSKCPTLQELYCGSNQLTSLDVSGCSALRELHCSSNQLTSLDVSKNTALQRLDCDSNQLTSLDVSGCSALQKLYYDSSNPLELLNLGDANPTEYYYNGYSSYKSYPYLSGKLGNSTKLKVISNKITKLDVSENKLQSLDVSECPALQTLDCNYNPLELLTLGVVAGFDFAGKLGNSTKLKVISDKITKLNVSNNGLKSLDVSECPALEHLKCDNNKLTKLDVSKNANLQVLSVKSNGISAMSNIIFPSTFFGIGDLIESDFMSGIVFQAKTSSQTGMMMSLDETQKTWYNAKTWCSNKGDGWYLPSRTELQSIYKVKDALNATLSACGYTTLGTSRYWSSTEGYNDYACYVNFSDGVYSYNDEHNTYTVRAILAF